MPCNDCPEHRGEYILWDGEKWWSNHLLTQTEQKLVRAQEEIRQYAATVQANNAAQDRAFAAGRKSVRDPLLPCMTCYLTMRIEHIRKLVEREQRLGNLQVAEYFQGGLDALAGLLEDLPRINSEQRCDH